VRLRPSWPPPSANPRRRPTSPLRPKGAKPENGAHRTGTTPPPLTVETWKGPARGMLRDPLNQTWRGFPPDCHAIRICLSDLLYKGQAPRAARAVRRDGTRPAARRALRTCERENSQARERRRAHARKRTGLLPNQQARKAPTKRTRQHADPPEGRPKGRAADRRGVMLSA